MTPAWRPGPPRCTLLLKLPHACPAWLMNQHLRFIKRSITFLSATKTAHSRDAVMCCFPRVVVVVRLRAEELKHDFKGKIVHLSQISSLCDCLSILSPSSAGENTLSCGCGNYRRLYCSAPDGFAKGSGEKKIHTAETAVVSWTGCEKVTDHNSLQVNLADSCTIIYKRLYDSELILLGDDTGRGHQAVNTATLNGSHTKKVKVLKCIFFFFFFWILDYFFSPSLSQI